MKIDKKLTCHNTNSFLTLNYYHDEMKKFDFKNYAKINHFDEIKIW